LPPIEIDGESDARVWSSTLPLADRFGLSAYDACYLELSQRRDLPLATLDARLRAASAALGLATPIWWLRSPAARVPSALRPLD
jgi:predicted nucleic acid-binding protein